MVTDVKKNKLRNVQTISSSLKLHGESSLISRHYLQRFTISLNSQMNFGAMRKSVIQEF